MAKFTALSIKTSGRLLLAKHCKHFFNELIKEFCNIDKLIDLPPIFVLFSMKSE